MFYKSLSKCPVCLEATKEEQKFIKDYQSSEGNFSLYECFKCETQYWMPFKNPGAEWYEKNYVRIGNKFVFEDVLATYHKVFLNFNRGLVKGIRLLDLGCGTGKFISEAEKLGADVWGVDFDSRTKEIIKLKFGIDNVFGMPLDEFFQKSDLPKFDYITAFEVFEHLDNSRRFLKNINNLLKPNGILALSVPSRERILVDFLPADFPPHHLTRWNLSSIKKILTKEGFVVKNFKYNGRFFWIYITFIENKIIHKIIRFGAVKKTFDVLIKNDANPRLWKIFIVKLIHFAAKFKDMVLFAAPALILAMTAKLLGYKAGNLYIEAVKSDYSNK